MSPKAMQKNQQTALHGPLSVDCHLWFTKDTFPILIFFLFFFLGGGPGHGKLAKPAHQKVLEKSLGIKDDFTF